MNVTHVVGDLFATERVIAHGCNTRGAFAAGVAGMVKDRYPNVEAEYQRDVRNGLFVAGTAQFIIGRIGPADPRYVYNLGTQREPGRCSQLGPAAYWPIWLAFGNMVEHARQTGIKRIAIPRIGCGIAGLKWSLVQRILDGMWEYVPDGPEIVVYTHPSEGGKDWG